MEKIRFVCATRVSEDEFDHCALGLSLQAMQIMPMFERRIFSNNQVALGEVYNQAIDEALNDPAILVFFHDDVFLPDFFMVSQIYAGLQRFELVGVAGNTQKPNPASHRIEILSPIDYQRIHDLTDSTVSTNQTGFGRTGFTERYTFFRVS